MVNNGRQQLANLTTAELLTQVEELRSEVRRRAAAEVEAERTLAQAQPRRSQMSPAEVSRFIRSHPGGPAAGAEAFRQLPK